MRRANAVAVGDGGEALDVLAEQPADGRGLRLAQLRISNGHMGHRAVMLANLRAGWHVVDGGGVPILTQRIRQAGCSLHAGIAVLQLAGPRLGEVCHRTPVRDETQDVGGQLVVGMGGTVMADIRQRIDPGRPAPPSGAPRGRSRVTGVQIAGSDHGVEVPAYPCGRQPELLGERGGGSRATLQQETPDPLAGAAGQEGARSCYGRPHCRTHRSYRRFHNTSVSYIEGYVEPAGP